MPTFTLEVPDVPERPYPGEAFHIESETYPDGMTGYVLAATVERGECWSEPSRGRAVTVVMPDGLRVHITRVPLDGATSLAESKRTQLSVFILTEGMGDADHDAGKPLMQVALNDATLYDEESNR